MTNAGLFSAARERCPPTQAVEPIQRVRGARPLKRLPSGPTNLQAGLLRSRVHGERDRQLAGQQRGRQRQLWRLLDGRLRVIGSLCITGPHAASEDAQYDLSQRLVVHDAGVLPNAVTVLSQGMEAACEGSCLFTYDVALTPARRLELLPREPAGRLHLEPLPLCGASFTSPVADNSTWIGGQTGSACVPRSGNASAIHCVAPALTAGSYSVRVFAFPNGFAKAEGLSSFFSSSLFGWHNFLSVPFCARPRLRKAHTRPLLNA